MSESSQRSASNNLNDEIKLYQHWRWLGPVSYTHLTLPTTPYV